jgi:hypothetical protein
MKLAITIGAAAVAASATLAHAAPSAEEIKQLGTTLTPWGAEKAGNKDGTIPEYTGGLTKPPANYDRKNPGWRPDPYASDKLVVSIDAKNVDKYADKLSQGVKEMIRKYPGFRIDVYPTHRSAAYPQQVVENTLKNATRCALTADNDGLDTSKGCHGGIPFPIPKTGYEVIWNKNAHYGGTAVLYEAASSYVKPSGEIVRTSLARRYEESGLYNDSKPDFHYMFRGETSGPARIAGGTSIFYDALSDGGRRSWSYVPATRRVRLAPDVTGDTPIGALGGAVLYDEGFMFSGKMDRYDFKLVGKKEMYIPYNNYKLMYPEKGGPCDGKEKLQPNAIKPECVRFELHRVWHVQATLKPNKRHVYGKRDFFIDEDAWYGGLVDNYDLAGKIYRASFAVISSAASMCTTSRARKASWPFLRSSRINWGRNR